MADIAALSTKTTLDDADVVVLQPAGDVEPQKMTGATMRTAFKGDQGTPSTVPGPQGNPGTPSTVPGPQGNPGTPSTVPGPQGTSDLQVYRSVPDADVSTTLTPMGGAIDVATLTVTTAPTDWLIAQPASQTGMTILASRTTINPAAQTGTVTNATWSVPFEAGGAGPPGPAGAASTVPGPQGDPGADSTVPGPAGAASTVPGPQGDPGADSTVPGPAGAASTVPGPQGDPGADSTIPGPPGPAGSGLDYSALTAKAVPIGADELPLFDSEDMNSTKRVTVASLPGGGGVPLTTTIPSTAQSTILQTSRAERTISSSSVFDLLTNGDTLNTNILETPALEIVNLDDVVSLHATGIAYFGLGITESIQLEQAWYQSNSDTEAGTFTTTAAITGAAWTSIHSGTGITFRSKLTSGGTTAQHRDYQPSTFTSGTWADMGFVTADVGKWVKFAVAHRKGGDDSTDIGVRYGWKLFAMVAGEKPIAGLQGATGPTGAVSTTPGPAGNVGQQGPMGNPGAAGAAGATGAMGNAGAAGNNGAMGLQGNTGIQGPIGPAGPAGGLSWQDEMTALGAFTTINLVGAGVTGVVAGGVLTITIPGGGGTPAQTHSIYIGWRVAGNIPTGGQMSTDIPSNADTDTDSVVIPNYVGQSVGYLFIWRSDLGGGDPSEVYIGNSGNFRNGWGTAETRTISIGGTDVVGKAIISVNTFNVSLTYDEVMRIV